MKRRTRTTCLAFIFGTLALLAQGQDLAPLSSPPTIEQAAGQQSKLPELTLEEAVEQAIANNSSVKIASLDTLRAADDLAANKTRRFANTQVTALGAQLVTKPSFTYPAGSLGVYSATIVVLDLKLIRWEQQEQPDSAASEKPSAMPLTAGIAR
jgi:hypothetical protein